MRRFFKSTFISASLCTAFMVTSLPAFAKSHGYESALTGPLNTPVKIEVVLSEDLAYRANNRPKKMQHRSSIRLNAAFANNSHLGEKELGRLIERLRQRVEKRLIKEGVQVSDSAPTTLRITLEDAKPNRPTFTQMSRDTSLSYQSFGTGGAEINAEIIQANGARLGTLSYRFYETSIEFAHHNATWSDANRAIDRFARKAAKTLDTKS